MSHNSYVLHCAWLIRCGEAIQANQRLTIVDGVLQDITDVPNDERFMIRPVAVLPALVNAHTHLEFSDLPAPLPPPSPFPDWIRSVVKYRRGDLAETSAIHRAVTSGFAECQTAGTSIVGEICTSDAGRDALVQAVTGTAKANSAAVCFRELLGFTADRVSQQQQLADQFVDSFCGDDKTSAGVTAGLSPHAPYSVHPEIVQYACGVSKQRGLPIAMHLAETRDEVQFIESQSGRFVDFLDGLGLWQPETLSGISSIVDYLTMLQAGSHALAIHGNYFNQQDLELLGKSQNVTTVYCVRTHRWFGHRNHPWQQIEAAGGRVILGTDSRASNPDLGIWKELQAFCKMYPSESLIKRLPMISTDSAAAIGLDPSSVNLKVGAPFRATAVATSARSEANLESSLLQSSAQAESLSALSMTS